MTLGSIFQEAAGKFLAFAGKTGPALDDALRQLTEKMEPEFEQALNSEDVHSVDFVVDRVAAETAAIAANGMAEVRDLVNFKDQLGVLAGAVLKGAILLA